MQHESGGVAGLVTVVFAATFMAVLGACTLVKVGGGLGFFSHWSSMYTERG